ncbi:MAG: SCO family protein, partial [Acidobacteria bacterium]|nr:SCO family protein [Acidobacteriota bacterium]
MKAALLLLLILPACSCARRIPARGMVLQIDPARQTVLISHQEIPAYMSAMVMPFRARGSGELAGLYPGAQIDFQLVVRRGRSHIERIRLRGVPPDGVVEDQGDRFRIPVPPNKIAVGEVVPDFRLTDQAGRPVRLSDFRGKVVAVDFIYTRCPLPEVCPRLSANFARLQGRFADLVLLSITLDPDHDTPEELARYARIWKA